MTSSTSSSRSILVTGATGKQGGAVVRALLDHPPPFEHTILALTRNATSPAAIALSKNPNVEIITGDLDNVDAIFEQVGGIRRIWGVFAMQVPGKSKDPADSPEVKQGCALIDASIKCGVQHFVQTSVDRKGAESDKNPTNIPHFITKHIIEQHLMNQTQNSEMTYTIIRPVAFMDMLAPNMFGRLFASMWADMGDAKLQVVSVKDIGIFAAQALSTPELDEYKNKAFSVAGDELTQAEANEIFWKVLHRPMPMSYRFLGRLLKWGVPEVGTMFQWFVDVGYGANIQKCRLLNSQMLDLETFLKQESKFTVE